MPRDGMAGFDAWLTHNPLDDLPDPELQEDEGTDYWPEDDDPRQQWDHPENR